ncbi:oxidation resistance 1 isoform X1 [Pelobates cultripes]|uniref:Oxidation resistance protein 1 n=1 Tax=Pelobates cultripes TaxID=61616 RepID=A0AAD1S269_PELCU|nr:oxidation resistance 1 isoform X1 [Pelobates cultripes]
MFSTRRLKKKSQSVDITSQSYNPLADIPAPQTSKLPLLGKSISEEEHNNTTNAQKRLPRRGDLKRGYTIDTGQKKTLEKKDGRRMSFQKPKGTMEYTVESRDSLNSIALKFDTTPNELVQLNKLFSRAVVPGQLLYVPDPDYISSVESSPSLSPISPLSPTSSEVEFEKSTGPDHIPHKESTSSPAYAAIRPSRVVSSTSEEEEAFTEKFLKINCKYITDGKGTVSGVLLVTPNNIMFDPHKTDPLVQENGCEEYGIMCPMEEVTSAAMYKEIVNSKLKDSIPVDLELTCMREFYNFKKTSQGNTNDLDAKMWDAGNDSASTAPRSTEESLSEDVFTESELSPIREELLSSDELIQDKSSGASSESVQTINQTIVECCSANLSDSAEALLSVKDNVDPSGNDSGIVTNANDLEKSEGSFKLDEGLDEELTEPVTVLTQTNEGLDDKDDSHANCNEGESAQNIHQSDTRAKNLSRDGGSTESHTMESGVDEPPVKSVGDSETEVEELRKLWKNLTMQQAKQQREDMQHATQKDTKHKISVTEMHSEGVCSSVAKEKRRHRSHKYLCLRVGKPMRKTFVSQASASMQQYAQRDKLEYWFAVPHERTDHLYSFFIQWSPELYAEELGESSREPGFVVVKKNEESESSECSTNDSAARLWEVVSVAEYHRRIDALNTEELRTLCRRLKITTREDVNPKQATSIRTDLEPETFRPNLSDPSELLQVDQIEKLTKHLPPRTIGYPWTLVYSTAKHGMSIKTLYRTMLGLDTPVLMVIKDSDAQVFGALASEPFKVSDCFYGTGETFLFTFCPEFEVFKWTGDNMFFIKGDMDSLAFGGGGGEFALWLDGDLYHGRSHTCKTFGNSILSKKEDFIVQDIEIWAFE